jgi:UDPglucose 6-dehydrogenase
MNTITIMGTGYVGLVTGSCLSEFGLQVICLDKDDQKIGDLNSGKIPIYEPGLASLVAKNHSAGRLIFTSNIRESIDNSNVIFLTVGTPSNIDGSVDLQDFLSAAQSVGAFMKDYKVIVNKSTVPVGTGRRVKKLVQEALDSRGISVNFDVVSSPEFLREGSAIRDFMHPDRVVIGGDAEKGIAIIRDIYSVLNLIDTPFIITSLETAELVKYATNAFLATKITFINEIANLCDVVKADIHDVAKAMGLDGRIGRRFLHPGPGFGGSCLPKDTRALVKLGQEVGVNMRLTDAVIRSNEYQRNYMVQKIMTKIEDLNEKVLCILGLAFKPETDDLREAPSIGIIKELLARGACLKVFDPVAMENARKCFFEEVVSLKLTYCRDEYDAATGADALVILTEWNQFRHLDLTRINILMRNKFLFDFRNVYEPQGARRLGFIYEGIGR